jgi:hypothetical protein
MIRVISGVAASATLPKPIHAINAARGSHCGLSIKFLFIELDGFELI